MAYRPYIWRKSNPEKRLEQKRREKVRKALRKRGILPPCGQEMNDFQKKLNEQISNNDFSYWNEIKSRPTGTGGVDKQTKILIKPPEYILWYRSKENAKKKGLEFNLDLEDITIPEKCPYLKVELKTEFNRRNLSDYYSIDRIDSSKGYVKGNVQVISRLANTMKNNATPEQLITFAKSILEMNL